MTSKQQKLVQLSEIVSGRSEDEIDSDRERFAFHPDQQPETIADQAALVPNPEKAAGWTTHVRW